mmetsp:Transcript_17849/g.49901  ORF Transcript_17849/g.49901 Transcript_17849/m.49901 type:complete len:142 (-) Transcript_17849:433-858(-)|eukprot:CAMPEP_0202408090 /NCGR_PEP_ID=MMETSP1128-20130828/14083_1 /ASSEMBLY_ACC=CAM_ASM_000463 /TAXON_ID=3047 /ORGANISM="Dunaliella tertiolecta, Strain CCMP1320" /LENGTH=141 /DNA_ID=CAMNT_0049013197 /DNA_START=122 /DNA_END=547 /DNA_ORIENTATION=-
MNSLHLPKISTGRCLRSSRPHVPPYGRPAVRCRAQGKTIVHFTEEGVTVEACSGDPFTQVAEAAGVDIPLGCNQGNCGVCEVEVEKFSTVPGPDGSSGGKDLKGSGRSVIRSCIAKIPPGYARVDITQMTDQIWGVDGFDT